MRVSPASHVRRRRPGAAASAYSLALALVGDKSKAATIASSSLRKGAGSRTAVIAHARREALSAARPSASLLDESIDSSDLRQFAEQLAATRPPLEQAIVNLELRSNLDTGSFARVLGVPADRAVELGRQVTDLWAGELDPAMMAWLGPGSCEGLSVILRDQGVWPRAANSPVVSSVDSTGPVPILRTGTDGALIEPAPLIEPAVELTVRSLLNVAPLVREHAVDCDICAERLRLLTPVRTLVGQTPLEEVPSSVASVARVARRRLPAPLPPSIERRRLDYTRLQVPAFGVLALVIVIVGGITFYESNSSNQPSQASRVAKLVDAAPASRLLGTPTIITPATKTASLANTSNQVINWKASTNESWLTLSPTSGRVQPNQSISIAVTGNAPASGTGDANITITGDDGSTQTLKYATDGG